MNGHNKYRAECYILKHRYCKIWHADEIYKQPNREIQCCQQRTSKTKLAEYLFQKGFSTTKEQYMTSFPMGF